MISPAKAHFLRKTAEKEAAQAAASGNQLAGSTGYELMLAKVDADMRRLKDIQSIDRKIEVKRELLPDYDAYIDGAIAGDTGVQDDVLMTAMVWQFDIGNFDRGLQIAEYALRHKLALPGQYKRTLGTLIAEEISDAAKRKLVEKETVAIAEMLDPMLKVDEITKAEDMPDESRARLYKAIGLVYASILGSADEIRDVESSDYLNAAETALDYLRQALSKDDKCGVKKDIERIERYIKNLAKPKTAG